MARDVKAPPVARYREIEARESGSAIHKAIIRCHALESRLHRAELELLRRRAVRWLWWFVVGGTAYLAGVVTALHGLR